MDRTFGQPFLNYAHRYSIETIKADILDAINRLNEGWKVLEERRKQAGRNIRIKKEIVKDRGNLVKEFLEAVYAYFEEHAIDLRLILRHLKFQNLLFQFFLLILKQTIKRS